MFHLRSARSLSKFSQKVQMLSCQSQRLSHTAIAESCFFPRCLSMYLKQSYAGTQLSRETKAWCKKSAWMTPSWAYTDHMKWCFDCLWRSFEGIGCTWYVTSIKPRWGFPINALCLLAKNFLDERYALTHILVLWFFCPDWKVFGLKTSACAVQCRPFFKTL